MPEAALRPREGQPYTVEFSAAARQDLRRRLRQVAFAHEPVNADWSYGTPRAYMRQLLAYWSEGFDCTAAEAKLNRFAQYLVPVSLKDGPTLRIDDEAFRRSVVDDELDMPHAHDRRRVVPPPIGAQE